MASEDKKNWFLRHKVLTGVLVFILLIVVADASGDTDTTTSTQANETSQTVEAEPEDDVPREYKSALAKANSYANTMHMSKQGVYDQLTSDYGEQFSDEAGQYAIDNVEADWNNNALVKARSYQNDMNMSPAAIRDQLVSPHGEQFTEEQADYAIANL